MLQRISWSFPAGNVPVQSYEARCLLNRSLAESKLSRFILHLAGCFAIFAKLQLNRGLTSIQPSVPQRENGVNDTWNGSLRPCPLSERPVVKDLPTCNKRQHEPAPIACVERKTGIEPA